MTSLGFLGLPLNLAPPKKKFNIFLSPPNYFGLKFLGPLPKIRGKGGEGAATIRYLKFSIFASVFTSRTAFYLNPIQDGVGPEGPQYKLFLCNF